MEFFRHGSYFTSLIQITTFLFLAVVVSSSITMVSTLIIRLQILKFAEAYWPFIN